MRISLKELFGTVAVCAIIAWYASRVSFGNGMFWMATAASAVLSAVFVYLAKDQRRRRFAALAPVPLLGCCLLQFVSLSLLVNGALLFGAGLFCAFRPPLRVKTLCMLAAISATVALGVGVLPGIWETRRLMAMRHSYPIISLEERLQYERRDRRTDNGPHTVMSTSVSTRLNEMEASGRSSSYREYQLEMVHDRQYELFSRAIGFGVGRMIRPNQERLARPPLRDIPFDDPADDEPEETIDRWRAFWTAGKSNDVEHLHTTSQNDFLDPDSFGVTLKPLERVVGFVEHASHYSPVRSLENRELWTIVRLELVSLLKFEEPRAYVLDHLPRMDQLSGDDVPTRPLDQFESGALEQLWTEEDVVISREGNEYRMLGSLRAAKQCLDCHGVHRGDLLGAFSYVLRRDDGSR